MILELRGVLTEEIFDGFGGDIFDSIPPSIFIFGVQVQNRFEPRTVRILPLTGVLLEDARSGYLVVFSMFKPPSALLLRSTSARPLRTVVYLFFS